MRRFIAAFGATKQPRSSAGRKVCSARHSDCLYEDTKAAMNRRTSKWRCCGRSLTVPPPRPRVPAGLESAPQCDLDNALYAKGVSIKARGQRRLPPSIPRGRRPRHTGLRRRRSRPNAAHVARRTRGLNRRRDSRPRFEGAGSSVLCPSADQASMPTIPTAQMTSRHRAQSAGNAVPRRPAVRCSRPLVTLFWVIFVSAAF